MQVDRHASGPLSEIWIILSGSSTSRYHRGGLVYRICTIIFFLSCLLFFIIFFLHVLDRGTLSRFYGDRELMLTCYLVGSSLLSLAYLKASLDAPVLLYEVRKSGMLELILIAPLSRMAMLRRLGHPVGTQLVWNGSLILAWHLLAILLHGYLWQELGGGIQKKHALQALILLSAHLGSALILPIELLSIRNLGLWGGLKTKRPLKVSLLIFLIHFVVPVVSLPVILYLMIMMDWGWRNAEARVGFSLFLWHLLRILVSASLWKWCDNRIRMEFLEGRLGGG